MPLISADYGVECKYEERPWGEIKTGYTHFSEGDVGLAKITPCFENGKSTVFRNLKNGFGAGTTELHIVRPITVLPQYVLIFLKSPHFIQNGIPRMTGTAGQKRVPKDYFSFSPFPLPPLSEQHRIVAKVDELMALCDSLEAEQTKREDRRDRLVKASLFRVNQPPQPSETEDTSAAAEYKEHVRFHLTHLPRLTTKTEHVKELRQSILNLAVRGKLVEQDPNDEPAEVLLERIRKKKQHLVKTGEIRKSKALPAVTDNEQPFEIPATWRWVRVSSVADARLGKMLDKAKNRGTLQRYLRNVNVRWFDFDLSDVLEMKFDESELDEFSLIKGDVLICEGGEPGRCAVWDERETGIYFQKAIHRVRFFDLVVPSFFCRALAYDAGNGRLTAYFTGVAIKHFTGKGLASYVFPLPPLAEQHRIVAKVDELMALCDELEQELTRSQDRSRRLLEAVLCEALGHEEPGQVSPATVIAPTPPAELTPESVLAPETAPERDRNAATKKPSPIRQNSAEAILAHMQPGHAYTRADILDALGLSLGAWNSAIRELKEQSVVVQTGERRGARYCLSVEPITTKG